MLTSTSAERAGQLDDKGAIHASQDRRGHRGRRDDAVANQKQILAGALADISVDVEANALVEAIVDGLHGGQLGPDVMSTDLSQYRGCVGSGSSPGANANVDAALARCWSQVLLPFPGEHDRFSRVSPRVEAEASEALENQRTDITGAMAISRYRFENRP